MSIVFALLLAQAEMINLKAQFLSALGDDNVAHETFSEALMLFTLCVEAWVSHRESCTAPSARRVAAWACVLILLPRPSCGGMG